MKLEKVFDNFIPFIPIIYLFLSFIPGFIYKIIFGIVLFACLLYQNSKERIRLNKVNIAIVFLFIYFIGSFLLVGSYVKTNSILLIYNVFLLFCIVNLVKKQYIMKTSKMLFFLGVSLIILSVYEVFTGNYHFVVNKDLAILSERTGLYYPIIFFSNFNDLAYFLILLLPFSIYSITKEKKGEIISVIYILMTLMIGYFTQSIFAQVASLAYLCFISISFLTNLSVLKEFFQKYKKIILVVSSFVLILIIIFSLPFVISFTENPVFTSRYELIEKSFAIIKNHMWFGVGVGGYVEFMSMPPHNLFINIGVAFGLVGMIPVIYLYIYILYKYINNSYPNFFNLSLDNILGFSVLLFFVTNMMSSQAEGHFITWMFIGLSIVIFNDDRKKVNR